MKTLVAGVGNVFLGDDGFGVEVARRLQDTQLPADVRVADFGIRGVHLAYELLNGYDALIIVDAVQRGETPGTVTVLEPDDPSSPPGPDAPDPVLDGHDLAPAAMLAAFRRLGGHLARTFVVGCEPAELEERIGLSAPVAAAVDGAAAAVRELLDDLQREGRRVTRGEQNGERHVPGHSR